MTELRHKSNRAAFKCGLLLHAGYIGAAAVAAGLLQLFADNANGSAALALIVFGGILAVASWRRARAVVERDDRVPAATAHPQGSGRPAPFATSANAPATR